MYIQKYEDYIDIIDDLCLYTETILHTTNRHQYDYSCTGGCDDKRRLHDQSYHVGYETTGVIITPGG